MYFVLPKCNRTLDGYSLLHTLGRGFHPRGVSEFQNRKSKVLYSIPPMSQHEHFLNISLQLWPFSFKCLSIINFKSYKERKLFHETIFSLKSLTDDVSKTSKKKKTTHEVMKMRVSSSPFSLLHHKEVRKNFLFSTSL